jgi:hypothetical protein
MNNEVAIHQYGGLFASYRGVHDLFCWQKRRCNRNQAAKEGCYERPLIKSQRRMGLVGAQILE